jgi:hypothetical protein
MLLRQELRRGHQHRLVVILDGEQHGEQRDHGLAGPHVPHEQPVHPLRRRHVSRDLPDGLLLITGKLPGEAFFEPRGEIPLDAERHPAAVALGHRSRADQHQLEIEELIERQPPPSLLRLLH